MLSNPFLKAALLTALVVGIALLVVNQLDAMRSASLRSDLERLTFSNRAESVLNHYGQVMARSPQEQCPYLMRLRQERLSTTYTLAPRIGEYEKRNLFNDEYVRLKSDYLLSLADAYISSFELARTCGLNETPLAFFYTSKSECPDCLAQGAILDRVGPRCPGLRVYAMPVDSEWAPLNLLVNRYSVARTPALVVDDRDRLEGLQSEGQIVAALRQRGVVCS